MIRRRSVWVGAAAIVLIAVMATTGPRPDIETTGPIQRAGGVCLQLEEWGMFGWVIVGQTYTRTDLEEADWHTPPVGNPTCASVATAEYTIRMPAGAGPDVYRVCGLDGDRGCTEFRMAVPTPAP
jgi:hypothetical protein